jgi:cobalamin biosynthesis protein CobT
VGTFFTFNTWKPDQDRDAMVFIQGLAEDYEEEGEPEEDPEDGEDGEDEGEPEEEEAPFEEEEEEEPEEEEAEGEEEEWEPVKGETYSCKVTPRSKSTDVEITSVNKRQETVNVKRLSDKKVFKGIPWGKLE